MTPQEYQLVDELFDRLSKLENAPRDPDAERLIADGANRAPHAIYALVQTALVQDEALKRANSRIEELQAQLSGREQPQQQQASFLDSMREAAFGRRDARGSVPSVRPPTYQSQAGPAPQGTAPGSLPQNPYPPAGGFGTGGSFLGNAASAAAGVIGGALLLDGIRSMFGHQSGFFGHDLNAFEGHGDRPSPWGAGGTDRDRVREANFDDSDHGAAARDDTAGGDDGRLVGASDSESADDTDLGYDDGGFGGDDTDFA